MTDLKYRGTMTIDLLSVSRPVILGLKELPGTIIEMPVRSALQILRSVIDENKNVIRHERTEQHDGSFYEDWTFRANNNIVAFIGERGTGKSSCMLSALKCMKEQSKIYEYGHANEKFADCFFLQITDPSFFDEKHNIIELVIGELYSQFQILAQKTGSLRRDQILKLQTAFAELKHNMSYLEDHRHNENNYDERESLKHLASGVYLQSNIRKIIVQFLEFVGRTTLVIAIDDLDLSVQRSYEMMEQIRKYLVMPEAVILFSAKIEQLHQAVQLQLTRVYKDLYVNDRALLQTVVSDMADHYIKKFLPLSHRIYMPDMTVMLDNSLKLENFGDKLETLHFPNISDKVLDLIFQKTRFLFYNSNDHKSWAIPRNLRSLTNMIKLLCDMEDFDCNVKISTENTTAARRNNENKAQFRNFFFNYWVNRLSPSKAEYAKSLIAETEPANFNKRVLGIMHTLYYSQYYKDDIIATIVDSQNAAVNISVGDVLKVLTDVRNRNTDIDDQLFVFFVDSLYSMRLYENYDAMTDALDSTDDDRDFTSDRPMLRKTVLSSIPDFLKLVGGAYFSPDRSTSLMPNRREGNNLHRRDRKILNGRLINNTISDLISEYKRMSKDSEIPADALPDIFVRRVRLMEFFAFCSLRHVQGKDRARVERQNDRYRQNHEPYYAVSLRDVSNILFDVVAPLFNCARPFECLDRYSPEFAALCRKMDADGKMSLSNQLLKDKRRYGKTRSENSDLASRLCPRNMEVIRDIYSYLSDNKDKYRPNEIGDLNMYQEFFQCLGSYEIATYSLKEDSNEHHKISLEPMLRLAEFLGNLIGSDDIETMGMFDNCFAIDSSEIPQKGVPAYERFMTGYIYKPEDVRRIVYAKYPAYKENPIVENNLKFPKLKTSAGENIIHYLANSIAELPFEDAIGEDLQDEYMKILESKIF